MSQQEFAPGPQSQQPEGEDEVYKPHYPYSWSGESDSEAAPRDEPPSSYEYDPNAMLQGYQAQDIASQQQQADAANPYEYQQPAQQQQQISPPYQYNPYSNDGDAYEQGYNQYQSPYNASNSYRQGTPPWARPQPQQHNPFRFGWIIFVLVVLSMGSGIFHEGFWFFGPSIGFIFLPIFILMLIATAISRALWGGGRRGGWRHRGPGGW